VKNNPELIAANNNLAATYVELGKLDKAAEIYRKVIKKSPYDLEARTNLGNILVIQGKPAEAVKHLSTAVGIDPNDPELYFNLALANHMLGRLDEALTLYREFLRVANNGEAWNEYIYQAENAVAKLEEELRGSHRKKEPAGQ
ncbi:MAG: tetratricopeptide repeat protein, partial [Candidatus Dadabacteria bacterium]